MNTRVPPGCLSFFLLIVFLICFPIFLADVIVTALSKLGLSPRASLLVSVGVLMGGLINIPIKRLERDMPMELPQHQMFGFERFSRRAREQPHDTIIAVNLGGCLIPSALAVYQLLRIANVGTGVFALALGAVALNVGVCYLISRPVPGVGIAMPALVPGLVAAVLSFILVRQLAPPVAFAAGVLGPLLGGDLLRLGEVKKISTGIASIGGAGTFDGIVLSGLLATLLA